MKKFFRHFLDALVLISLVACFFTGCPHPASGTGDNSGDSKNQILSEEEIVQIAALKSDTFSESLDSLNSIITIIKNHKDFYSDDIIAALDEINRSKNSLPVSFEPSSLENLQKVVFNLGEKKSNNDNKYLNDSYSEYDILYTNAENAVGDYNSAYDEYSSAKNVYNTSKTAYDAVVNKVKSTVKDFQNDYLFQDNYDKDEISDNVDSARDVETNKSEYESSHVNVGLTQDIAQTALDSLNDYSLELAAGGNQGQGGDPQGEGGDPQGEGGDPQGDGDDDTPQPLTITLGDTLPADFSKVSGVTLKLPENTTVVDIVAFARLKNQIQTAFNQIYDDITRTITFAEYPETVTSFKLDIASSGKSNVDLMKEFVNPRTVDVGTEKSVKSTEVIPGVSIITYAHIWYGKGDVDNILYQSFKFYDDKNVNITLPAEYNLTGTYKGGIVGDKV